MMIRINLNSKRLNDYLISGAAALLFSVVLIGTVVADTQLVTWSFSSAAGQASSENMSTKMTVGQSAPGASSSSDNFESDGGYYAQDPVPPSAIGDLAATLSVNDIVLQWTHAADNVAIDHYIIFRGTDPDFAASGGDSIVGTTNNTYLDLGVAGDALTNYFYVVKATDPSANLAEDSNRVGEFDIETTNGTK
jgi:hypothetical protein